jgi:hypothetical protein
MANARRQYSRVEELELTAQVESHCPLCDAALFYKKKGRSQKAFELAHIYPLNPTAAELHELVGASPPPADVNDPDNIIPLCTACHTKFDKPRTREEYEQLVTLKQRLVQRAAQRTLNAQYPLEKQISDVVARLHEIAVDTDGVELQFDPKGLDEKFDATLQRPVRRKIKNAVSDYYEHVRGAFRQMEKDDPASSALIFSQVRTYYLKQKALGHPQTSTFGNVVEWIRKTSNAETLEAAEIVASFFVQNCEVFE